MPIALPYTITGDVADPDAIQGNFDAIKQLFPLSRKLMKVETPSVIGGAGKPDFQNGWANYGSGYQGARYWKDPFDIVHLEGLIALGTVGQPAFRLPAGYLPGATLLIDTISNSAIGRVDILINGDVVPASPSNNTWVSLNKITFKQEN